MAAEDRILKILLEIKSDISDLAKAKTGLGDVRQEVDKTKSAFGLMDAFKFAGVNVSLEGLRDLVVEVTHEVASAIGEFIHSGVEFAAELQQTQIAIAGVVAQTQPERFRDFAAASGAAAEVLDLLKTRANALGISYETMFETF